MLLFKRKTKEKRIAGGKPAPKKDSTKSTVKKIRGKKPALKKKIGKTAAHKPLPRKKVGQTAHKNASVKPQKRATVRKITPVKKTGNKEKLVSVTVKKHRDRNGNHNHVILESFEDKHVSVGLSTKDKKGKKGSNNKQLKKDTLDVGQKGYKPKNPTYMRRQGTVDKQDNYFRQTKGSMVKSDFDKAIEYGKRAKTKFLQKKSNGSAKHVNQSPSAMGQKSTRPLLDKRIPKQKPNVKTKK